jgi:hypothetical protein
MVRGSSVGKRKIILYFVFNDSTKPWKINLVRPLPLPCESIMELETLKIAGES